MTTEAGVTSMVDVLATTVATADSSMVLGIVVAGFCISFVLSFAMGANDTANSFGTSVGAKVLTLRRAYVLASVFETAGAIFLGHRVIDTMRKGVVDVSMYSDTIPEFMFGQIAILISCAVWVLIATLLKLPVSTTHSIVGATVGFSLAARGLGGVSWNKVGLIVGSWFISPVLSGFVSCLFVGVINIAVLNQSDAFNAGLLMLPFFYFLTISINFFSIFYHGSELLKLNNLPLWAVFCISLGSATLIAAIVRFVGLPWLRKTILVQSLPTVSQSGDLKPESIDVATSESKLIAAQSDDSPRNGAAVKTEEGSKLCRAMKKFRYGRSTAVVSRLFAFLQILSACFGSFAHGGNDISNAISPLVALWSVRSDGSVMQKGEPPIWITVYGCAGMCLGLWILGHRVIYTIGEGLTEISPTRGFSIEIGAALTVLLASKLGLPISSTHCKVGSVVCVGWMAGAEKVNWRTFANVAASWLVTVPVCGLLSATLMYLLSYAT